MYMIHPHSNISVKEHHTKYTSLSNKPVPFPCLQNGAKIEKTRLDSLKRVSMKSLLKPLENEILPASAYTTNLKRRMEVNEPIAVAAEHRQRCTIGTLASRK